MCVQHRPGSEVHGRHTGQSGPRHAEAGPRRELRRLWRSHKNEVLGRGLELMSGEMGSKEAEDKPRAMSSV